MMKAYAANADKKAKFEFLAIHDQTCSTLEEVDAKVKERDLINKYWGGQDLPFPVLLDANKTTINTYHISAFPTILLISPEGELVHSGHVEAVDLCMEIVNLPAWKLRGAKTSLEVMKVAAAELKRKSEILDAAVKAIEDNRAADQPEEAPEEKPAEKATEKTDAVPVKREQASAR